MPNYQHVTITIIQPFYSILRADRGMSTGSPMVRKTTIGTCLASVPGFPILLAASALANRAVSKLSDGTTYDFIPLGRWLRSAADIIWKRVGGNFPRFFSSSSLSIERRRIPRCPRISGDEVLR